MALKAPSWKVGSALINYLSDETFVVVERAAYEVLAELATGVKAQ